MEILEDDEFFHSAIVEIEKHISELKNVMDNITQMIGEVNLLFSQIETFIFQ